MSDNNGNKDSAILQYLAQETAKDTKEARLIATKALNLSKENTVRIDNVIDKHDRLEKDSEDHARAIQQLQTTTETQEMLLTNLVEKQNTFNDSLGDIQKTMTQIKWAAFGALGMFVLESFGLQEFLKRIFT